MGGGHVTRPDFGFAAPDPACPLTEFYLQLQAALAYGGDFAVPGAWARFTPPDEQVYADTIGDYCRFYPAARPGTLEVLAPHALHVLYCELPTAADGTPVALMLTEEGSRAVTAVQLLPPFAGALFETPLPPVPDCAAHLTLQLTEAHFFLADTSPARLREALLHGLQGKAWQHHPLTDRWLRTALAAAQRDWRRRYPGI